MNTHLAAPAAGWLAELGRPLLKIGGLSVLRNVFALTPALYVLAMSGYEMTGAGKAVSLLVVIAIASIADSTFTTLDQRRRDILLSVADGLADRLGMAQMRRALAPQMGLAGRLVPAMVGRDVDYLRGFAKSEALPAVIDLPFALLFLAVLAMLHWSLGLLGLVCAAAQVAWLAFDARAARQPVSRQEVAMLADEFSDAITRHADCTGTMGLGSGLAARWQKLRTAVDAGDDAVKQRTARWENAAAISRAVSQFVILAAGMVLARHHAISAGAAFAGFLLMGQTLKPMIAATVAWRSWSNALQAAGRLGDDAPEASEGLGLQEARGELTLEGVAWTPPGALRPALRGITLKIEAGAVLAIIGPSAAGKSTLARVLCGALRPARGVARLDGIELGAWSETLRGAAIGYLPQDVALFPGTIAENIARFGSATEFQILAAARLAGIHEMIRQLPDSYRTMVNERAGPLSAGQRQRVALARALLGDPPVLVLDEPDASLDAEGEAALIACVIEARRRRRTVVMITHNTALVRVADFVATMVGGHVMKVQRTADVLGRPAMLATG